MRRENAPPFPFAVLVALALAAGSATGAPTNGTEQAAVRASALHRILWYVPNRVFDLADIVRLRVRVGPGLALNARATKWAIFYAGEYHSVYAGLPGPRLKPSWPAPLGLEEDKGLSLLAVDATDTLPHEPHYTASEFTLGLHAAVAGAEAGFDPVELADFLMGFVLVDIRKDDH